VVRLDVDRPLVRAIWRSWGAKGIARRGGYEVAKRTGWLTRTEARTLAEVQRHRVVPVSLALEAPRNLLAEDRATPPPVVLYGGLSLHLGVPPAWHRHPLTGHQHDPTAHWSELNDDSAAAGDIKDVWELSRLGWLYPLVRRWARTGDEDAAELVWQVIEDWVRGNPTFRGPNWMCGQETSLRAITVLFLMNALETSPASTPARREMATRLVAASVARVVGALSYAESQRNNHAVSEAGFLWSSTYLTQGLPGSEGLRRRAAGALTEAVRDQFAPDGSYAQHSPTYQRTALHVLLWCLYVARRVGAPPPDGVADAVARSVPFLRSLMVPGTDGRMPNMGGNDGGLVFDLAPVEIGDFRALLSHAAAATGQGSGLPEGPWDEEARWFGLLPSAAPPLLPAPSETCHALTRGEVHAVLRAGRLRHRPAHADQLHTDIWFDGRPVAVDAGSYRYTSLPPWGNALAAEHVHNLPTRAEAPQARRSGRFFWSAWAEARVEWVHHGSDVGAILARMDLPDGTTVRRLVATTSDAVVVIDEATAPVIVRWNFALGSVVEVGMPRTSITGEGWICAVESGSGCRVLEPTADDPASGWHAPTYAVREPLVAVVARMDVPGRVATYVVRGGEGTDGPR
jgi:hypothetical protein